MHAHMEVWSQFCESSSVTLHLKFFGWAGWPVNSRNLLGCSPQCWSYRRVPLSLSHQPHSPHFSWRCSSLLVWVHVFNVHWLSKQDTEFVNLCLTKSQVNSYHACKVMQFGKRIGPWPSLLTDLALRKTNLPNLKIYWKQNKKQNTWLLLVWWPTEHCYYFCILLVRNIF